MPSELGDLLNKAAAQPHQPLDLDVVLSRAKRRRTAGRVSAVLAGVLVVAIGAAIIVLPNRGNGTGAVRVASPSPSQIPPQQVTQQSSGAFSIQQPPGWFEAPGLAPYMSDPNEIEALATYPLAADSQGSACAGQLPRGALNALKPTDAFIWVLETHPPGRDPNGTTLRGVAARPTSFGPDTFSAFPCGDAHASYSNASFARAWFSDQGQIFGFYVVMGSQITPERRAEVWQVLNSFAFHS